MLQSNTNKKVVIKYYEVIVIFFVFLVVLLALYPGNKLVNLIKNEQTYIQVAIAYLKYITKINPNDYEIHALLIDKYIKSGKINEAEKILEKMQNVQNQDIKKARIQLLLKQAEIVVYNRDNKKSTEIYIKIMQQTKNKEERKAYFLKALRTFRAENMLKEAVNLAQEYETEYINDKYVVEYLIKLYLACGEQQKARKLAIKIIDLKK